jgi:hypothetical protein
MDDKSIQRECTVILDAFMKADEKEDKDKDDMEKCYKSPLGQGGSEVDKLIKQNECVILHRYE